MDTRSNNKRRRSFDINSRNIKTIRVGGSPVGDRPKRIRKLGAIAKKLQEQETTEKEALLSELDSWDKSVDEYLKEGINKKINNELKESELYIQSYKSYMKVNQGVESVKDHFMNLNLSGKGGAKENFNRFKNKYKPFNLGGMLRKISDNLTTITGITETDIEEWKIVNKQTKVCLSSAQKKVLDELNRQIMKYWCGYIYGDEPPPQTTDVSWIYSQYIAMKNGNYPSGGKQSGVKQSDSKLMRLFSNNITPIKLDNDGVPTQLLNITKGAFRSGNSINNAAAIQNYNKTDMVDKQKQLFDSRDQYNCVVPSVIDPQSVCPNYDKKMTSENERLQVNGGPFSITITYNVSKRKVGSLNCVINKSGEQLSAKNFCDEDHGLQDGIIIDKDMPRKHLQISDVIKQLVNYIKTMDIKQIVDVGDPGNRDKIKTIVEICLGKLCGDFSQELYAISKILQGETTVYVANDQPSAIRFLYLIKCLRDGNKINQDCKWWGGYLSAQNNLLMSSIR